GQNRVLSQRRGDPGDGDQDQPLTATVTATGSAAFRHDCSQAAGRRPTHMDNSGISTQPTTDDGQSWTMCPFLRIRRLGVRVPPSAPPKSQVRAITLSAPV